MGAGFSCVAGKCVECTEDANCPITGTAMKVCKDNKCQVKCAKDPDCDPFFKCDTGTGACVFFGCSTTLECVSKTGNPLAVCSNKQCDVPCQSDPECVATLAVGGVVGQPPITAVMAGLQVCNADGHCVEVGCDSNDQCRILSRLPGGSKTTAECRPVAP
jgi:hypothetical protein